MDVLSDIIQFIVSMGLATEKDVDIFKDYVPDSPNSCIAISEYEGTDPAVFTRTSIRSIQILVRDPLGSNAKQKSWDIYNMLYKEDLFIDIGTRRCIISMRNTPFKMSVDSQRRTSYVFNFGLTTNF